MSETLQDKLRAMAEECVAGQRTSKSDRWAHTLVAAASTLDAQAQRIAEMQEHIDVLTPGASNYNRTLVRAQQAEARAEALAAVLRRYGKHEP